MDDGNPLIVDRGKLILCRALNHLIIERLYTYTLIGRVAILRDELAKTH